MGVWALDPESCEYDAALPRPTSGVYTMLPADERGLWYHARWRVDEQAVQQVAFHSQLGGELVEIGDEGLKLGTSFSEGKLITELFKGEELMQRSTRTLDEAGLCIAQELLGPQGWLRSRARYTKTTTKQVLVYRRDLKMRKGKIAAQCAHAAMAVFFRRKRGAIDELVIPLDGPMAEWVSARFAKICLSVEDEEALLTAHAAARAAGLPCSLITDAGRTEFHGVPTRTAIAIGPAAIPEIDAITGPAGLVACKLA